MRLPKLNLRDLFWLALVVGLGLGWRLQYQESQEVHLRAEELIDKLKQARESQSQSLKDLQSLSAAVRAEGYSVGARKKGGPMFLFRTDQPPAGAK